MVLRMIGWFLLQFFTAGWFLHDSDGYFQTLILQTSAKGMYNVRELAWCAILLSGIPILS